MATPQLHAFGALLALCHVTTAQVKYQDTVHLARTYELKKLGESSQTTEVVGDPVLIVTTAYFVPESHAKSGEAFDVFDAELGTEVPSIYLKAINNHSTLP